MSRRTMMTMLVGLVVTWPLSMGGCKGVIDKAAEEQFMTAVGDTTITVFSTYIRDKEDRYDLESATQLAQYISDEGWAATEVSGDEVPLTTKWGMNESRMYATSAKDFAAYIAAHEIDTDYALLAEYLIGGQGSPLGVHIYIVEPDGTIAAGTGVNSHHTEFSSVNPQTIEDCTEVARRALADDLSEHVKYKAKAKEDGFGYASSLTVLPVKMPGGPATKVGHALAGLLEVGGMPNLQPATLTFEAPADATWEQIPDLLAAFVRESALSTDYAMYAEILGTRNPPKVEEVRSVLVDRQGNVLWVDRQTGEDKDFRKVNPRNPMTCCVLASKRLLEHFDIDESTAPSREDGTIMQLWAEDSGIPSQEEREAIGARQHALKVQAAASTLTVYPVQLGRETDVDSAATLAESLQASGRWTAAIADADNRPTLEVAPSSNEMRRLWDLAKAFRTYVQENPPESDYALCVEYTIRPSDQKVWSVHTVLCDRAGEWVIVDLQNEYQADFKHIDPQDKADCNRLVIERVEHYTN